MLLKPTVLVLDAPTTHLALEAITALSLALQKFEGTVFHDTHDADLMEAVATRVWHFGTDGVHDFKGSYEEFAATTAG
jgi:ATPase subunit of ABC transporter with duplicated ATPase domains